MSVNELGLLLVTVFGTTVTSIQQPLSAVTLKQQPLSALTSKQQPLAVTSIQQPRNTDINNTHLFQKHQNDEINKKNVIRKIGKGSGYLDGKVSSILYFNYFYASLLFVMINLG